MDDSGFRRRSHRSNNSMQNGIVPLDEDTLQQSGIRGRRSCCLCTLLVVLLLVAILNAMVTVGLVYFLSITHKGMQSLEFLPGGQLMRILTNVHASRIVSDSGLIGGRYNKDVEISSEMGTLFQTEGSQVHINGSEVTLTSNDVKLCSANGKALFLTNSSLEFASDQVTNLHASQVDVGSISTRDVTDGVSGLNIESLTHLDVAGMEGVSITTDGDIEMDAKKNIAITSLHGDIAVQSEDGIYLDPGLPVSSKKAGSHTGGQYKLCVCMPSGKVFAVPILGPQSGCHTANEDVNPCAS